MPVSVSSNLTKEDWHPSSLLPYDTLLNRQDDFDSIMSYPQSTAGTGTDFYDRSLTSRRYALVGLACSSIIACAYIVAGAVIIHNYGVSGVASIDIYILPPDLMLNFTVTLCTESTSFVHGISLRSALASQSRLRFNTNLRLLTAVGGWRNPNGTLLNGIMAFLLIISYSSASSATFYDTVDVPSGSIGFEVFAGVPLLFLGVALLLQVVVALSGLWAVKILTWSSSPFDLTAAMVLHTQLVPAPFRCMPKPSDSQPSAWHAHPSIRKVVISLWGLVVACAGWAALVMCIWGEYGGDKFMSYALNIQRWSFTPNQQLFAPASGMQSNNISYTIPGVSIQWWILVFVNMAVIQGPLTLGLHCSELIVNIIRDERQWRCATGRKGLRTATNPLKGAFTNPLSLILFIVKPLLHWMFGLSFLVYGYANNGNLGTLMVHMFTTQIWNLCIALAIFACFFTVVALRRPRGPQPATYGHLQTLANLVDEWSPIMWWGHKEDGIPYCHSGTSDHPLPDVKMDCVYGGSGVESPASVSREAFTEFHTIAGLAMR
ncbi:uncharacterized protein BJ212DRAFT_1301519 [Suillus subaureus]|uniref:Uncharacterized protein n=1 Tax=Suillus subaureus TaxID=48587 RepID=A0A9P7JBC2_9AGAM|nr:uncharacterized protein BJ212DRAFT_1301519 [Suillus subaureus]KAG1812543.1 hypothetical protein BJ212DRAFT_1301519 [Suillus subaureus]